MRLMGCIQLIKLAITLIQTLFIITRCYQGIDIKEQS